jgi:hypothetical protein
MRPMMSAPPPGPNDTMMRIDFSRGQRQGGNERQ